MALIEFVSCKSVVNSRFFEAKHRIMKLRHHSLNAEILDDNLSQTGDYFDEDLMRNSDILHINPKRNF